MFAPKSLLQGRGPKAALEVRVWAPSPAACALLPIPGRAPEPVHPAIFVGRRRASRRALDRTGATPGPCAKLCQIEPRGSLASTKAGLRCGWRAGQVIGQDTPTTSAPSSGTGTASSTGTGTSPQPNTCTGANGCRDAGVCPPPSVVLSNRSCDDEGETCPSADVYATVKEGLQSRATVAPGFNSPLPAG